MKVKRARGTWYEGTFSWGPSIQIEKENELKLSGMENKIEKEDELKLLGMEKECLEIYELN